MAAALMAAGCTLAEAWEMSPIDSQRITRITQAWSIDPDRRVGGVRAATAADAARLLR